MPRRTDRELAESHRYRLPNGDLAVSVTAVSGSLDISDKAGAFAGAAVKLERQGLNYREEWKARAERGSRIHAHMERWLRDEDTDAADDEQGYLDALEKWITTCEPVVIESEQIVLSDLGYGGRFDLICRLPGGKRVLVDLKTGSAYPVEHTLQLAAYRYADGLATYDADGKLASLRPMPEIDAAACLYVHDDGSYDFTYYDADLVAFDVFGSLLRARTWAKGMNDVTKLEDK